MKKKLKSLGPNVRKQSPVFQLSLRDLLEIRAASGPALDPIGLQATFPGGGGR